MSCLSGMSVCSQHYNTCMFKIHTCNKNIPIHAAACVPVSPTFPPTKTTSALGRCLLHTCNKNIHIHTTHAHVFSSLQLPRQRRQRMRLHAVPEKIWDFKQSWYSVLLSCRKGAIAYGMYKYMRACMYVNMDLQTMMIQPVVIMQKRSDCIRYVGRYVCLYLYIFVCMYAYMYTNMCMQRVEENHD